MNLMPAAVLRSSVAVVLYQKRINWLISNYSIGFPRLLCGHKEH